MTVTIVPVKSIATILCVVGMFLCCKLASLVPTSHRNEFVALCGKFWTRACLFSLGFWSVKWVKLEDTTRSSVAKGKGKSMPERPVAIVANHMSWVDIPVHMSHSFPSFVARDGTQNLPLIGIVSQKMQCLYVQRENKGGQKQSVATQVKERMLHSRAHPEDKERPILLFPEGTTTNGQYLLPFKTGAFLAGVPVQPVVVKYRQGRFSPCWESIDAKRHIFMILCEPYSAVTCYELPVYYPTAEEQADPVLYARNVRNYMLKYSKLQPSDAGLEDKRAYQDRLRREHGIPQQGSAPSKSMAAAVASDTHEPKAS